MAHPDISPPSARDGPRPDVALANLDRILELFERRKLSATELRVLLALIDRGAGVSDLTEALDQSPDAITRAARRLSARGLIRWHHTGSLKQTRFDITSFGLTTVRALLTAVDASAARPTPPRWPSASRRRLELRNGEDEGSTATDLVLTVTQMLRERGVVGRWDALSSGRAG